MAGRAAKIERVTAVVFTSEVTVSSKNIPTTANGTRGIFTFADTAKVERSGDRPTVFRWLADPRSMLNYQATRLASQLPPFDRWTLLRRIWRTLRPKLGHVAPQRRASPATQHRS